MDVLLGIREAPREIVEEIRQINPRIRIRWDDRRDRWVIYEIGPSGEWAMVRILEDPETREYIELDGQAVQALRRGDTWSRVRGVESILDDINRHDERRRAGHRKALRNACIEAGSHAIRRRHQVVTVDMGRSRK